MRTPTRSSDQSLAQQAFEAFRDLLACGQIRSGQMISISELVEVTGLPLAPVREAVKRAAAAGLVSILPQRGVLILEATAEALHAGFHLRYLFDQEGARLLAQQAPDRELAHLRQEHERVLEQASEGAISAQLQLRAMEVDWSLHAWLTGALNNPVALAVYEENRYRLSVMQHSRRPLPERIIPAMTEHLQIIDHIQTGAPEKAVQAVRSHLQKTLRWWGIVDNNGQVFKTTR